MSENNTSVENRLLFDFYMRLPDGSAVPYQAFFDGSCFPSLAKIGEERQVGPMFIAKNNKLPFFDLTEALTVYTRFAVSAKLSLANNTKPLAESLNNVPSNEKTSIFMRGGKDNFDYNFGTAAQFARSLESLDISTTPAAKLKMVPIATSFAQEVAEREARAQAQPPDTELSLPQKGSKGFNILAIVFIALVALWVLWGIATQVVSH